VWFWITLKILFFQKNSEFPEVRKVDPYFMPYKLRQIIYLSSHIKFGWKAICFAWEKFEVFRRIFFLQLLRPFLNQIIIGYLARNNLQHLKKKIQSKKSQKLLKKNKIKIWPKCSKLPTLPKLKRFGPKSPLGAKIYMTVFNNKGANLG
jgi:hypothetical protein